ncbi:MAG TPA: VWA domain-containing protein [Candidatus Acidoferrum sp.]|nr:VWA domain-containing protein [Candidatus Acidoferrum sp.]
MNPHWLTRATHRKLALLFVLTYLFGTHVLLGAKEDRFFFPRAPSTQAKISVATSLVVVPVNVMDSHAAFVPGLKAENFQIQEDGRPQNITLFREEDTPVGIGLVVDHSRSMGPKLPAVTLAVNAFAHSSNPRDEMFVVDFSDSVSVELMRGKPFTHDARELQEAISAVSALGQTSLYDAVAEALIHIELSQWDKKAIIIVSDGGDNASRMRFSELLERAQRAHVLIYSIGLVDEAGEEENPRVLQKLANATGGLAFFTKRSDEAANLMKRIARDLREQYTLGYAPPASERPSFHRILVRVSSPGSGKLRVRARPGYFSNTSKPQSSPAAGYSQ